jgi:DNA-binding MarR family transcriptional regulator
MSDAEGQKVDPASLDLVVLTQLSGFALAAAVLDRLADAGHPEVRTAHGFLIQHLINEPRPVGEIANRMGVTQQAVSKSASELESMGYLERVADPGDGRVRILRLTRRGRSLVDVTREIRRALESEIEATVGQRSARAARRGLLAALEVAGGVEAIRARRVRAPG